jgi:MFS family permease
MQNEAGKSWQRPELLLFVMAFAVPLSMSAWQALLNNYAIEVVGFSGREIGILQSLREIPGFLAFAIVLVLLLIREQSLALLSLLILGLGTALTGFFPTTIGLYLTTVLMSFGFHYYDTIQTSLAQQWIPKNHAAELFGRLIAFRSLAAIIAFTLIWVTTHLFSIEYRWIYLVFGCMTIGIAIFCRFAFPLFQQPSIQTKKMVFRRRYWLYYCLVFMSGARRQIFVVFAGFMMVEQFGYSVSDISLLFLINATLNVLFARKIGRLISRFGERNALVLEYCGLILIFSGYALVETGRVAALLYILDHLFFALAISLNTYFQKIADPQDIASTAGVSFTINHIAAVCLPVLFGLLWLYSHALVFVVGAFMALLSLLFSLLIPRHPDQGVETCFKLRKAIEK